MSDYKSGDIVFLNPYGLFILKRITDSGWEGITLDKNGKARDKWKAVSDDRLSRVTLATVGRARNE